MLPQGKAPPYAYMEETVRSWLEAAGATIVPILPTITAAEAAAYFDHIHGLFLHEGWADTREYLELVTLFLNMATLANRAGDYFPIWGTCQGMQLIMQHFGGVLERVTLPVRRSFSLQPNHSPSRLLAYGQIRNPDMLFFSHEYGITLYGFMKHPSLRSVLKVLSTSHDREGMEYVSMIEGRDLPFYGTQFHPDRKESRLKWMAVFFVAEARKSNHSGFDPGRHVELTRAVCHEKIGSTLCLRTVLKHHL